MAIVLPIKAIYDGTGQAIAFQEFELGDTLDGSYVTGLLGLVPTGGNANEALVKVTGTDYDYGWASIASDWGTITGLLSNQIDLQNALNAKSDIGHVHTIGDISGTVVLINSLVTYETLDANGDVGNLLGQLAIGNHNHDLDYSDINHNHDIDYSDINHTHTKIDVTDFIESDYVHIDGFEIINGVKTFASDIIIQGNMTVQGTTVTVQSNIVNIGDNILTLNSDLVGAPVQNAGIEINRGTSDLAQLLWNETTDVWEAGIVGSLIPISLSGHAHLGLFPMGGTTGQSLKKLSGTDYDVSWQTDILPTWGGITGTLSNQTDLQLALDNKEPTFVKNTAFNKDFGTTTGTVSEGDHIHVGGVNDISITNIGGQMMATVVDTSRANKNLSIDTSMYVWTDNRIDDNDWIRVGEASDSLSGYIMPFDSTLVYTTSHTEDADNNSKGIRLYVNNAFVSTLFTISGNNQQQTSNTTIDIDFQAGDKIRLRGSSNGDLIKDTVITLHVKNRG